MKLAETSKKFVREVFLSDATLVVYYDHHHYGKQYGRLMVELIMTRIVKEFLERKGVPFAFIDSDVVHPLQEMVKNIRHLGSYNTDAAILQCYVSKRPVRPKYIIFIVGDDFFGSINRTSESGHVITDLMFDVIGLKSDKSMDPLIFGNDNFSAYLFKLN